MDWDTGVSLQTPLRGKRGDEASLAFGRQIGNLAQTPVRPGRQLSSAQQDSYFFSMSPLEALKFFNTNIQNDIATAANAFQQLNVQIHQKSSVHISPQVASTIIFANAKSATTSARAKLNSMNSIFNKRDGIDKSSYKGLLDMHNRNVLTLENLLTEFESYISEMPLQSLHPMHYGNFGNNWATSGQMQEQTFTRQDRQQQIDDMTSRSQEIERLLGIVNSVHSDVQNLHGAVARLTSTIHNQGPAIDTIHENVDRTTQNVQRGHVELQTSESSQVCRQRWKYIMYTCLVFILIILVVVYFSVKS